MTAEKRHFRRYPKQTDFHLSYKNKSFNAKMIDYSLTGVGIAVKDPLQIGKGDILDLTIKNPEITDAGEVMWINKDSSELRIGIKRSGQKKGLLKDYRFEDTLIGLQKECKTDILSVGQGDIVKRVYFRNGDMIFSASNQDGDRLGDMLLRDGRITLEQYEHSFSEMERTKQRCGEVLVSLGYIMPDDLRIVVRHQLEEIFLSLFTLEYGWFSFEEMMLPTEEVITLKLSAANLIYYGIKRINNIARVRTMLPSMDSVLYFSADPYNLFQDITLDYSGKEIISNIDGKTPIKDVISATQLNNSEALKTIYALLSIKMLEIKNQYEPFIDMPVNIVEEISEKNGLKIDQQVRDMIEDMHNKYDSLGYYGVLGIKDYATTGEIKSAYYKAAKKFHPDVHFNFTEDSIKDKLSKIFSYVYEAYVTLSHQQKRKEYDNSITIKPARLSSSLDKARAKYEEGKIELRRKKYSDAETLFGQAIYLDRTTAKHHFYYGLALSKQGKFKNAVRTLEMAFNLDQFNAKYIAELGFAYLELGFRIRARGFFEKALKISPDNARASEGMNKIKNY